MEIKGKVVVVTGGARGIGRAIAERMGAQGARVVIADIKQEELDQTVGEMKGNGIEAMGVACNVAREEDVERLMQRVVDTWGRLDVAVLNAGILRDGLLVKVDRETGRVKDKLSIEQWQAVIDVNMTGVFLCGREAAVQMVNAGNGGAMILMSSIAWEGNFGQTNYSAAKAGVRVMAVVWARELARHGIRVNVIAPGIIGTPMVKQGMKPEALERFVKMVPLRRMGEPDEVAHVCQFLVENDFVTGSLYEVTGGLTM